jgi:hypothetical protein
VNEHRATLSIEPAISLARVLASVRGGRGRPCALGLLLVALVPLAHANPPDPVSIPGIYDVADSEEVVWALTGIDTVGLPVQFTGTALLLPVSVLTVVGFSPVVAVVISAVRPRSPQRI